MLRFQTIYQEHRAMTPVQLDLKKLLGFKIIANESNPNKPPQVTLGAKLGTKEGIKNTVSLQTRISAKIGDKIGRKLICV